MTEEERMMTFVATTVKSADIMLETACSHRGTEKRLFWEVMQERNVKPREDSL